MKIYIPTAGRQERQETAYVLRLSGIPYTIVTPAGETGHHDDDVVWTPPLIKGIMQTRNWILDFHRKAYPDDPKLVMMDDDLVFYARNDDGKKFLRTVALTDMMSALDRCLELFAHGGVTEKFMSQTKKRGYIRNARYYHILAYNLSMFPTPHPRARVEVGEDHDMNLQLLTSGRPNFVLTEWANSDKPYAPGGCAIWRNPALELLEARRLAQYFPTIVKVVEFPGKPCRLRISWSEATRIGALNNVA